jgi:hypothetical protein
MGDFDNDGDLDIAIAECGGPALLFRNDGGNRNHWISIAAKGSESNRFGVGSRVRVTLGDRAVVREINPSGSYLSTGDDRLHIGLGGEVKPVKLEIEWPSGKKQVLENQPADRLVTLDEAAQR